MVLHYSLCYFRVYSYTLFDVNHASIHGYIYTLLSVHAVCMSLIFCKNNCTGLVVNRITNTTQQQLLHAMYFITPITMATELYHNSEVITFG